MATDDEMEGPYAGMYEYLVNFLLLQTRVIRLVRFIWFHEEVFRNSFESNFSGVMINNQYFWEFIRMMIGVAMNTLTNAICKSDHIIFRSFWIGNVHYVEHKPVSYYQINEKMNLVRFWMNSCYYY